MEEETRVFLKGARSIEFGRLVGESRGGVTQCETKEGESLNSPPLATEAQQSGVSLVEKGRGDVNVEPGGLDIAASKFDVVDDAATVSLCGVEEATVQVSHHPTSTVVSNPGDNSISPYLFVAGEGSVATKLKKQKPKNRSPKVEGVPHSFSENMNSCNIASGVMVGEKREMVDHMISCNIAIGSMVGEKRKLVDNMIVDDICDLDDLGSKKHKRNDFSEIGSNVIIAEAEVGCDQPRRAL